MITKFYRKWSFWKFDLAFSFRSKRCFLGRFGGGWNWQLGFQAGGNTIIFNLLIADFRISYIINEDKGGLR
ncbi:MAG TPA: hypothetical protein ENH65_01715 [Candidatus Aminicenantes bacterium]|nr:hypothetical protein [Candidatus Aminicenantes bacterium]